MKAIVQDTYGPAEVLELRDIDRPPVADDEVLLRVHAAGVDRGVRHLMIGLPYPYLCYEDADHRLSMSPPTRPHGERSPTRLYSPQPSHRLDRSRHRADALPPFIARRIGSNPTNMTRAPVARASCGSPDQPQPCRAACFDTPGISVISP